VVELIQSYEGRPKCFWCAAAALPHYTKRE
jgi:hypothetical protein